MSYRMKIYRLVLKLLPKEWIIVQNSLLALGFLAITLPTVYFRIFIFYSWNLNKFFCYFRPSRRLSSSRRAPNLRWTRPCPPLLTNRTRTLSIRRKMPRNRGPVQWAVHRAASLLWSVQLWMCRFGTAIPVGGESAPVWGEKNKACIISLFWLQLQNQSIDF